MKSSIILVTAAVLAAGAAQAAPAFPFSPAKTNFTASGAFALTTAQGTANCTQTLAGYTGKNGMAHITSVAFSGADAACANTAAAGLPWKVMPTSASTGKIVDMSVVSGAVSCGPALVRLAINAGGVWSYSGASLPTGCRASATIPTNPAITPSAR